jgi:hypothetical protein
MAAMPSPYPVKLDSMAGVGHLYLIVSELLPIFFKRLWTCATLSSQAHLQYVRNQFQNFQPGGIFNCFAKAQRAQGVKAIQATTRHTGFNPTVIDFRLPEPPSFPN